MEDRKNNVLSTREKSFHDFTEDIKLEIREIQPPKEPEKERLLLGSDQDNRKLVLLVESTLSAKTQRRLNQYCSTYNVQEDDKERWIHQCPDVDVYVVDVRTSLGWYTMNYKHFDDTFIKIYYQKIGILTEENVILLGVDYIRKHIIKNDATSKKDLFDKLSSITAPKTFGFCGVICHCLFSKITMCDCCSYTGRCIYSFF